MKWILTIITLLITSKALSVKSYPFEGTCETIKKERQLQCMDEDKPHKELEYSFKVTPTSKSSQKTEPCSLKERNAVISAARQWINTSEDDDAVLMRGDEGIPNIYVVDSCTVIDSGSPSKFILSEIAFPEDKIYSESQRKYGDKTGLVVLGKIDDEKIQPINFHVHRETSTDGKNIISVAHICDTNGDDKPDILLKKEGYYTDRWLIYTQDKQGFKSKPESLTLKAGCGC